MPADASIYQNFLRAPKSVQDYDNEAMQAQQNALALQNAKIQQNALQQQQADSATYRNALKGFGSDATANYNTLIRAGLGAQAEAYKKNATDQEKVKADADKARLDAAAKKIDIAGQAFNYVRLNPTLDNANAVIDYLGQNGIYSPEQVAQYKAQVQQNPDGIGNLAEMAFRSALNTKEQLANIQTRNLGGTTDTLSIDPVTGATKTVNSVRNTASPGDLLQAETTRRGQDVVAATAAAARQQADEHFKTAQASGGKAVAATEDERKAAGWLSQADNAWKNMQAAMGGVDPKTGEFKDASVASPGVADAIASIPSFGLGEVVGNSLRSPERQKFNQAASSLSEAILRAATGAGVNKDEALQKIRELTPVFGEDPATTKQKMGSIPMYLSALKQRAGRAIPQSGSSGNGGGVVDFGSLK